MDDPRGGHPRPSDERLRRPWGRNHRRVRGRRLRPPGAATGLIVTAAGLAPLIALVPVGRLLDVHGERRVVTAGGLWLGLGGLMAALAPSYPVLLAALLVGGTGYATAQPGGSKAVAGWFPERRGLAMGIRQTGLPLGGALAAATLPALAASWGWRPALAVAGTVGVAGAVAFGLIYSEPGAGDDNIETSEFGPQLRRLLRMPSVRAAAAAGFVWWARSSASFPICCPSCEPRPEFPPRVERLCCSPSRGAGSRGG